jgi:hypothetical protein
MSTLPAIVSAFPVPPSARPVAAGTGQSDQAERRDRPVPAVARIIDLREEARARQARRDPTGDPRRQERQRPQSPPVFARPTAGAGTPLDPASIASAHFLAQMLDQASGRAEGRLAGRRDGSLLSSDAYRRAGAQPAFYSTDAKVIRIVA